MYLSEMHSESVQVARGKLRALLSGLTREQRADYHQRELDGRFAYQYVKRIAWEEVPTGKVTRNNLCGCIYGTGVIVTMDGAIKDIKATFYPLLNQRYPQLAPGPLIDELESVSLDIRTGETAADNENMRWLVAETEAYLRELGEL